VSLLKAFERTVDRGFVPYRKMTPAYKTLAEEAKEFEYTQTIPKKLKELEERLEGIETTLSLMRQAKDNDPVKAYLEPIASRIAQIEAQMGLERAKTNGQLDIPNIIVPEELRVLKGKLGRCNNRKYEIVKRRWALWKAQYEAGSSFCSSGVSVALILSNTCCENAMAINFTKWYGLLFSPITRQQNSYAS